jgi:hypothetical protein
VAAEDALRRALELSPALPQAHYYYAQLEADTARTEAALGRLLRRLRVRQTDPEIYAGLIQVCRYCGLLPASVAAYESAVALDPSIVTSITLTRLAALDIDAALDAMTDDDDDGFRIVVMLLSPTDRRAEALEIARRAPPRVSKHDNTGPMRLAMLAYLEGRMDDALAALHAASGVDPQNDHIWPSFPDGEDAFWMARFYARLGRIDLGLLGFRATIDQGYFCVSQFDAERSLDPLRSEPAFAEAMALARTRHERAIRIFADEGGPALLGVTASPDSPGGS